MKEILCIFIWLAVAAAAPAASAQEQALAILKKADQTHRELRSYEFAATQATKVPDGGGTKTIQENIRTLARGKTEFRMERDSGQLVRVSDGHTTWEYIPDKRQFTREAKGSEESYFSRFTRISEHVKEATLQSEQTFELEGERILCYVVRAEHFPRPDRTENEYVTYWIDKNRWIVLREEFERHTTKSPFNEPAELQSTVTLTRVRLNPSISETEFTFVPPAGVREVDAFLPGRDLTGEMAPDFTLKDLHGREFRLADTRGKVVLLDFWATWCPPCREAMPVLEKVYQEFKGKGLLVVGMNVNDSVDKAKDFAQKTGITYPVVLAKGDPAVERFQAQGLPVMMVIARDGKVAGHYGGWSGEAKLREHLKQAGIE